MPGEHLQRGEVVGIAFVEASSERGQGAGTQTVQSGTCPWEQAVLLEVLGDDVLPPFAHAGQDGQGRTSQLRLGQGLRERTIAGLADRDQSLGSAVADLRAGIREELDQTRQGLACFLSQLAQRASRRHARALVLMVEGFDQVPRTLGRESMGYGEGEKRE